MRWHKQLLLALLLALVPTLSHAAAVCPVGQFSAEYFNNVTLTAPSVYSACETAINYNWGSGGPGNGVNVDKFSVRWTGLFSFNSETYEFTATVDDGVRLWLDGVSLLNVWRDQGATTYKATLPVTAGEHEVKMEYYENGGLAVAKASWVSLGVMRTINPKLTWTDNSTTESGFRIERCTGIVCTTFAEVGVTAADAQAYTDTITNDPGNATYCYRARAYNSTQTSAYSNTACLTSPPIANRPPDGAPANASVAVTVF